MRKVRGTRTGTAREFCRWTRLRLQRLRRSTTAKIRRQMSRGCLRCTRRSYFLPLVSWRVTRVVSSTWKACTMRQGIGMRPCLNETAPSAGRPVSRQIPETWWCPALTSLWAVLCTRHLASGAILTATTIAWISPCCRTTICRARATSRPATRTNMHFGPPRCRGSRTATLRLGA